MNISLAVSNTGSNHTKQWSVRYVAGCYTYSTIQTQSLWQHLISCHICVASHKSSLFSLSSSFHVLPRLHVSEVDNSDSWSSLPVSSTTFVFQYLCSSAVLSLHASRVTCHVSRHKWSFRFILNQNIFTLRFPLCVYKYISLHVTTICELFRMGLEPTKCCKQPVAQPLRTACSRHCLDSHDGARARIFLH